MGFVDVFRKLWGWLSGTPSSALSGPVLGSLAAANRVVGTLAAANRVVGTLTEDTA